jgi:hypothetical protein
MSKYKNQDAFEATVEITKAAVASGTNQIGSSEFVVIFMQRVYDKLVELEDAAKSEKVPR